MSSQQELIDKPLIKYSTASCCYPKSQNQTKNISFMQQHKERVFLKKMEKNKIELYFVNPVNKKHPVNKSINDVSKSLEALINNAKSSIDIAAYGFSGQDKIINALKRAKERGVIIRGVVDDYGTSLYPDTTKMIDEFGFKTDVYAPLTKNKMNTDITRSQSALMHNKFAVIDKKFFQILISCKSDPLNGDTLQFFYQQFPFQLEPLGNLFYHVNLLRFQ